MSDEHPHAGKLIPDFELEILPIGTWIILYIEHRLSHDGNKNMWDAACITGNPIRSYRNAWLQPELVVHETKYAALVFSSAASSSWSPWVDPYNKYAYTRPGNTAKWKYANDREILACLASL